MVLLQAQMRADLHLVRFTLALRHVRNGGILALAVLHCKRLHNTSWNLHKVLAPAIYRALLPPQLLCLPHIRLPA